MNEMMAYLMAGIWLVDIVLIVVMLFVERKRPETALCWLLAMVFLPIVGSSAYLFFGIGLPRYQTYVFHKQYQNDRATEWDKGCAEDSLMLCMNQHIGEGRVHENTQVEIFVNGADKYSSLTEDIERATSTIHLLYFIIRGDRLGHHLIERLTQKARQGVRVRLLYDHGGSFFTSEEIFRPLREAGGEVARFFPIRLGYYLRVNYRNHRKIVVIDGKIGYLGGMNIGEEYLGETVREQIPWRDSHLRIVGSCVHELQRRFLCDWHFAKQKVTEAKEVLFPTVSCMGTSKVQIISSGPYQQQPAIKWNYLRMIYGARHSLWLQTPYFVPDESFLEAVRVAVMSGVDVRLILSSHSDNRPAQKVSVSYAEELWKIGAKIAFYPGFLHSKMGIADTRVATLGTANLDRRSFTLNFETNAFLYDAESVNVCRRYYLADWERSKKIENWRADLWERAETSIWRLFAPIL